MSEYYCVIKDKDYISGKDIFWKFKKYFTFYSSKLNHDEKNIIECFKKIHPTALKYSGTYEISSFDPKNGHLPGISKILVILETVNGSFVFKGNWTFEDPRDMFKYQPERYLKID